MNKLKSTVTALDASMLHDNLIFSGLKLSFADVATYAEFSSVDEHSDSAASSASESVKKLIIDIR